MKPTPQQCIGTTHEEAWNVGEEQLASHMASGTLPVFATPCMVALMEYTCMKLVEPCLEEGITTVGTVASIVPLVIASFPFVARLVESSLREVNPNIIEMAQSMGASPLQIIMKVMIPESVPSLLSNFTIAITTILGYSAMSGAIGGGGLGKIAISYGYNRYKYLVMLLAVILLVILVQIFQSAGTRLAVKSDKRLKGR